ncbi:MAG: hypothetical protein FGF51_08535 [Candidatus Brockarchaeota archaeon]|nr:hypothetical protein [Candidatus Brockarchaeota archaeon]
MVGRSRIKTALVAVILVIVSATPLPVNAEEEVRVNWLVEANPGFFFDVAFSTCEKGPHIYVAGFDSSSGSGALQMRVEKRLKSDGSLVGNWTYMPSEYGGLLYDCVIAGDRIYAAGAVYSVNESGWMVLVLDLDLNLLSIVNLTTIPGAAISAFCDQEFLYVAGISTTGFSEGVHVRKMRLSDLSLVKEYSSNLSDVNYAYDIALNPLSNQIWVVGNVNSEKWRVEILDKDLNLVKYLETDIGSSATSIGFDEDGYSYVVGDGGILKLSGDAGEVKRYVQPVLFAKTLWLGNRLYVAGGESVGDYIRQVLYVFDRELNLLNRTVISMSMDADAMFLMGKMVSDGENIYVAGLAYVGYYDYEWVVCSVKAGRYAAPWYVEYWYVLLVLVAAMLAVSALLLMLMRRRKRLQQAPRREQFPEEEEQREDTRQIG